MIILGIKTYWYLDVSRYVQVWEMKKFLQALITTLPKRETVK